MILPTVHINGTSADCLLEGLETAYSAVRQAIEAVGAAAPNGRDYYVQGDTATQTAISEHNARVAKLQSVYTDLQAIAESVYNQKSPPRWARKA